MMMRPLRPSKPSISASSWLSVCSRSSWPPIGRLHADLAERVELVDEDDARRLGFGLREQIAHARGADADEHLHELRAAEAEEGDLRFAGDGAREQRLAGARRADQQHALGDLAADRRELLRRLQELDDLLQLLLRLVHAGDVAEAHLDVVVRVDLGLAAGERHDAALGAAHAAEEEGPEPDDEQQGNDPAEHFGDPAAGNLAGVLHAVRLELLGQLRVLDADGGEGLTLAAGSSAFSRPRIGSSRERDFLDLVRRGPIALKSLYEIVSPVCSWKKNACASASSSRKPRTYQTALPGAGADRCGVHPNGGSLREGSSQAC